MYGTYFEAGIHTNADVTDTYKVLFKRNAKTSPGGPPKLDAQVIAVALATYVTRESLVSISYWEGPADAPGLIAGIESYGFDVTIAGIGSSFVSISGHQAAFGVGQEVQQMQIIDLLLATDRMSVDGLLYDDLDGDGFGDGTIDELEELLRILSNDVYSAINESGGIEFARFRAGRRGMGVVFSGRVKTTAASMADRARGPLWTKSRVLLVAERLVGCLSNSICLQRGRL